MFPRVSLVVFGIALVASALNAQDDRLAGGALGLVDLLKDEAVQAELMLDKAQRDAVTQLADQLNGARDGKAQALASAELTKSLKQKQLGRLRQIHWQRLGPRSIHESQVHESLRLTDKQQKALQDVKAVNDSEHRKMLDFLRRARFRSREAMEEYKQGFREAADKRLLDVLTKEQRASLKELMGKPFKSQAG